MFMAKLNLLVVAVLASLPLLAQTDTAPPQGTERNEPAPAVSGPMLGSSAEPEPEESPLEEHVVPLPPIVSGFAPTLSFSSKTERSNVISGGVAIGANYDDNALISGTTGKQNWSYSVFPSIDIQKTTSRTRLDLDYSVGLTINQELMSQNQASHALNLELLYRLSPHVNFIVDDRFSKTSGIFSQYDSTAAPQSGSSGGLSNLPLPVVNQLGNATNAEVGYQFSAEDALGFSGGYRFNHFSDVPTTTSLLDYHSSQASAFYTHRLTLHNWIGISYRFQRLTFTEDTGETITHEIFLFHTFTLPRRVSISLFGGPGYNDVLSPLIGQPETGTFTQWVPSGGASLGITGPKTAFSISFTRRVTDGGGYQGATESTSFDAGLRRRMGPQWLLSAGGGYSSNDSLTAVPGIPPSIRSAFINCGVEKKFGEHISLNAGYSHELLQGQDVASPDEIQRRNRIIFAISYGFTRPLGR
jgi:hypothetical protein